MPVTIIPPAGGWAPHTYYVVEAAVAENNPIFGAIFYTGFLDPEGNPAGYNQLYGQFTDPIEWSDIYYLRAIRPLCARDELDGLPNVRKLPKEVGPRTPASAIQLKSKVYCRRDTESTWLPAVVTAIGPVPEKGLDYALTMTFDDPAQGTMSLSPGLIGLLIKHRET